MKCTKIFVKRQNIVPSSYLKLFILSANIPVNVSILLTFFYRIILSIQLKWFCITQMSHVIEIFRNKNLKETLEC